MHLLGDFVEVGQLEFIGNQLVELQILSHSCVDDSGNINMGGEHTIEGADNGFLFEGHDLQRKARGLVVRSDADHDYFSIVAGGPVGLYNQAGIPDSLKHKIRTPVGQ